MTTVSTTSSSSNPLVSSSSSSSTTSSSISDFQTFLKLFTAQLENQDPSNPMDTTQMTNQLALFSEVEQQASTNSKLDKLLAAINGNSLTSAVGYIGKTVEASGDQISLNGGSATIGYSLPSTASSVSIEVMDSSGTVVNTLSGDTASGKHSVRTPPGITESLSPLHICMDLGVSGPQVERLYPAFSLAGTAPTSRATPSRTAPTPSR